RRARLRYRREPERRRRAMRCLLVPLLLMGCAGSACVPRDEPSPTESLSTGGEAQVSAGGGGHGGIDSSGSPPVSSDTGGLREGHEPASLSPTAPTLLMSPSSRIARTACAGSR